MRRVAGLRARARWTPTTSWPASTARAAATAESTPPLIAASTLTTTLLPVIGAPLTDRHAGHGRPRGRSRRRARRTSSAVDGQPEREAQRAAGDVRRDAHGEQHVAGLRHAGLAGRAGGALDAAGVEQVEQGVALAAGEREVRVAGQPAGGVGVAAQLGVGHGGEHGRDEVVAQGAEPGGVRRLVLRGQLGGDGEGRIAGASSVPERTPRSWPPPCSTGDEVEAAAGDERAGPDRAADLVARSA